MWALNDAPITNRQAVNLLSEWKKRHWLHSDRWLPLRQAPYFGVRPLTGSERRPHLLVPAKLLSQDPPRAVPFSHLDASLQSTIVRRHPPAFSLRGFPMLVEASRDQAHTFVWRQASASEFLDGCLFPRHGDATRNHLLADPQLVAHEGDRQWPSSAVPILNVQETTNPFAIDASLEHVDMISRAPLATCYSSGLTTVAAQFGYASLMWLDSDQLTSQKLRLTADAADTAAHAVPVTETPALYHVSQLSVPEQAKWLQRIPRFVLLHSLTTPFVLFRGCWTTWRRFGLTTPPSLDHVYRANPSLPQGSSQPLLWVCPWHSTSPDQADQLTDGFTGSPLHLQRNYSASFFNACQLTKE